MPPEGASSRKNCHCSYRSLNGGLTLPGKHRFWEEEEEYFLPLCCPTPMNSMNPQAIQTITSYKCCFCNNYLSVPPVMTISSDGKRQKCGRCKDIKSEMNVRNTFYEDMARLYSFPCMYLGCHEQIQWGQAEDHEKLCPKRTIRCNILGCQYLVVASEYQSHCAKVHPALSYLEKFHNKLSFDSSCISVLIKDEIPFLIFINASRSDFWVSVFCFYPSLANNWKYDVRLSSQKTGRLSVVYEKQTVVGFDERKHCTGCVLGQCELKHHPYSKLYGNKPEYVKTTNVSVNKILELLNAEYQLVNKSMYLGYGYGYDYNEMQFLCTITLTCDEKPKPTKSDNKSLDESFNANSNLLQKILQCPICMEYMRAPIFTCTTGHTICSSCESNVDKCPTCQADISDTRMFCLEEAADNVEIPCSYKDNGCNFLGNVDKVKRHEEVCALAL